MDSLSHYRSDLTSLHSQLSSLSSSLSSLSSASLSSLSSSISSFEDQLDHARQYYNDYKGDPMEKKKLLNEITILRDLFEELKNNFEANQAFNKRSQLFHNRAYSELIDCAFLTPRKTKESIDHGHLQTINEANEFNNNNHNTLQAKN